jgi:hypothetical protein
MCLASTYRLGLRRTAYCMYKPSKAASRGLPKSVALLNVDSPGGQLTRPVTCRDAGAAPAAVWPGAHHSHHSTRGSTQRPHSQDSGPHSMLSFATTAPAGAVGPPRGQQRPLSHENPIVRKQGPALPSARAVVHVPGPFPQTRNISFVRSTRRVGPIRPLHADWPPLGSETRCSSSCLIPLRCTCRNILKYPRTCLPNQQPGQRPVGVCTCLQARARLTLLRRVVLLIPGSARSAVHNNTPRSTGGVPHGRRVVQTDSTVQYNSRCALQG